MYKISSASILFYLGEDMKVAPQNYGIADINRDGVADYTEYEFTLWINLNKYNTQRIIIDSEGTTKSEGFIISQSVDKKNDKYNSIVEYKEKNKYMFTPDKNTVEENKDYLKYRDWGKNVFYKVLDLEKDSSTGHPVTLTRTANNTVGKVKKPSEALREPDKFKVRSESLKAPYGVILDASYQSIE